MNAEQTTIETITTTLAAELTARGIAHAIDTYRNVSTIDVAAKFFRLVDDWDAFAISEGYGPAERDLTDMIDGRAMFSAAKAADYIAARI